MFKTLILFALVAYSLQIDHCLIEEKMCEACKTGYNLIDDSNYILYYTYNQYCKNTPIAFCQTIVRR